MNFADFLKGLKRCNFLNAFAISCYRAMLNIKRIDHVLNTTVYSMTNTVPLIHLVRHRQLKFLGHILRMSKEEPARRYALYIPTIGKRRPGRPRTSYLNYVQRLLGDNEGAMQEQQVAAFADDRRAWRNLVVVCSAADEWWWWWWWWWWTFSKVWFCGSSNKAQILNSKYELNHSLYPKLRLMPHQVLHPSHLFFGWLFFRWIPQTCL